MITKPITNTSNENDKEQMTQPTAYHVPVLLKESVDGLNIQKDGIYVDVTFGGGGHSREVYSRLQGKGHLYSFDQDADAEANAEGFDSSRFTFVRSNFRFLKNFLKYHGVEKIDGLIADLGVSSHHFDESERGFSFRFDGKLDMRMNQRAGNTAADVVNTYAIVKARQTKRVETIADFMEIVKPFFRNEREKKDMAKVFQALRIEVNHEMEALRDMLRGATDMIRPGGRLVVITYHSLEDRIVKNLMKTGNVEGKEDKDFFGKVNTPYRLVNRQVIVPSDEEQERNPRSRSAKLRIAEKL